MLFHVVLRSTVLPRLLQSDSSASGLACGRFLRERLGLRTPRTGCLHPTQAADFSFVTRQ